jgi:hypothetical protein
LAPGAPAETASKLDDICNTGAKSGTLARIKTDRIVNVLDSTPRAHLMLMAFLKNPKCLDLKTNTKEVLIYSCHGRANQRWSFVDAKAANQPGLLNVRNDAYGKGSCLTSGNKKGRKYVTRKCVNDNPAQQFTVLKKGLLKNKLSGMCLNINGGRNKNGELVIDWPCEDVVNEKWYYEDPAVNLITPNPGAHLALYVYPNKPICLDMSRRSRHVMIWSCHGEANQKWSVHGDLGQPAGGQIWNDAYGSGSCLTSGNKQGRQYVTRKCVNGNKAQQFEMIGKGRIRNKQSGMCLNVNGARHNNGAKIIDWPCRGVANDMWHVLK